MWHGKGNLDKAINLLEKIKIERISDHLWKTMYLLTRTICLFVKKCFN